MPKEQVNSLIGKQLVNFVFTMNNPTISPDDLWIRVSEYVQYIIFQKERGENGTVHYQGYVELKKRQRFTRMHYLFLNAHIESRRGNQKQAIAYCSKEDTRCDGPWENGIKKTPGKRSDLTDFVVSIRRGDTINQIIDDHGTNLARYTKFYGMVKGAIKPQMRMDLRVELHWGAPGMGKTRYAYEKYPDIFPVPIGTNLWFDNYDGQKQILIDDFTGNMKLDHLLQMLDIYRVQIPVKGGYCWLRATTIIITSNVNYTDWYNFKDKNGPRKYYPEVKLRALARRIHFIKHYDGLDPSGVQRAIEDMNKPVIIPVSPLMEDDDIMSI